VRCPRQATAGCEEVMAPTPQVSFGRSGLLIWSPPCRGESVSGQRCSPPSFLLIQVPVFCETSGFRCGLQVAVPSSLVGAISARLRIIKSRWPALPQQKETDNRVMKLPNYCFLHRGVWRMWGWREGEGRVKKRLTDPKGAPKKVI